MLMVLGDRSSASASCAWVIAKRLRRARRSSAVMAPGLDEITASLRATAKVARLMPRRLATDMLQAHRRDHLGVRVISTVPALYSRCCSIRSPHSLMCPDLSILPVRGHRHGRARRAAQDAHEGLMRWLNDHDPQHRPADAAERRALRSLVSLAASGRSV